MFIARPSVILYWAGAAHQNAISSAVSNRSRLSSIQRGLDTWRFRARLYRDGWAELWAPSRARWRRSVATKQSRGALRAHVQRFLERAYRESQNTMPNWLATITQRLREDTTLGVSDLAREVGRHASWLGTAYRQAVGEGLLDTAARYRVERAACLLRETDLPARAWRRRQASATRVI